MTNTFLEAAVFSQLWLVPCRDAQNLPRAKAAPRPRSDSPAKRLPRHHDRRNRQRALRARRISRAKRIAPGSVIPVELTKTVDAKKAKTGDEVIAKVTQDMKTGTGEVIVAKDTKMIGHVTEAQAHTKEQKQSELGIAFDKAVTKGRDETGDVDPGDYRASEQ